MKKITGVLSLFVSLLSAGQTTKNAIAIIPEPVTVKMSQGSFTLPSRISISGGSQADLKQVLEVLRSHFSIPTGSAVSVNTSSSQATIRLSLNKSLNSLLGKERYQLSVTPKNISIRTNETSGL